MRRFEFSAEIIRSLRKQRHCHGIQHRHCRHNAQKHKHETLLHSTNYNTADQTAYIRTDKNNTPEIERSLAEYDGEILLTERQREVLDSITRGLSNDNIATQLGISKSRVKQHLNELYEKLGAHNRAETVSIALRRHILKL